MSEDVDHSGLSLVLDLRGLRESIFVRSSDLGRKLWSNVQTLAKMHRIKLENTVCLRPDGNPLLLDERLSVQGLYDKATLRVCEVLQRKHETVFEEDMSAEEVPEYGIKAYLWSKEEREAKAVELKEKANGLLKAAAFAEARDMYSVALAWLPPGESDMELVGALFANRSLVHIKLERWEDAQADAEQALQLVPSNLKAQFRLGLAAQHLGDLHKAAACFKTVLEKDPQDLAVQRALLAVQKRGQTEKVAAKEEVKETPLALKWRVDLWQQGYSLPRLQYVWRDLSNSDHLGAWAHAWRQQVPLEAFFREGIRGLIGSHGPLCAVVLGTGSMAAAKALSGVGDVVKLTVLEPSKTLADMATDVLQGVDVVQSPGQLDADVAIPASAFGVEQAAHVLVCDRICDDLVGERLIPTMKAGLDAAKRQRVGSLHCLPSRAELFCAPLELRCSECLGFDASAGNALRFTVHSRDLPPAGARQWACSSCGWRNVPQVKVCELCRAARPPSSGQCNTRKQESSGCWPVNLEAEMRAGHICRFMGKEQLLCAWDFDESFSDRIVEQTFDVEALQSGHVNALAVWWRLMSPGSVIDTGPYAASWPAKRQAVFHLGYEIGVEKGEQLQFRMHFSEQQSRISFEMLKPRLVDRMGLMKFQLDILNESVLDAIRSKLDMKTNRLTASVEATPLKRRDKLLSFGPFDLLPGTLSEELWRKVRQRLERHAERPRRGDEPIRCVFQHGTFEGTRRWPLPTLRFGATVPRRASYFERFSEPSVAPYAAELRHLACKSMQIDVILSRCLWLKHLDTARSYIEELPGSRVLELNCGPVPLLSLCAAEAGARAWATRLCAAS